MGELLRDQSSADSEGTVEGTFGGQQRADARKKTAAEQYVQSLSDLLTEMQCDMPDDQWSGFRTGAVLGDVEDEDEEDVLREERKRRLRAMRAAP
jgi:hypothetical protein